MHKSNNRAAIFHSFDALKGFKELLQKQEEIIVEKKELSPEDLQELNYTLQQLKVGMIIQIIYYNQGKYIQLQGKITKLNFDLKMLQIVKQKIHILSIVSIEIL